MAKNSITDYDNTAANNTDIQSVDIDEGCAPSGINNAIRELMADLADVNDGTVALTSPEITSADINGGTIDGVTIGGSSAGAGTFTTFTSTGIDDNASSTAVTIDAGGSVLIGKTTPADLHNTWNHIIIGEKGAIISQNGAGGIDGITLADNAYIDADTGTYAYQTAAAASLIIQSGGVTKFSNAASGSAGAALTPLERMRIDSSGNVGIGTSSPATALDVNGRITTDGITSSGSYVVESTSYFIGNAANGYRFNNAADTSNLLVIKDDGKVGIGTSSPASSISGSAKVLQIDHSNLASIALNNTGASTKFEIASVASDALIFSDNGSERMRIDSSGNVGIGTNSIYSFGVNNTGVQLNGVKGGALQFSRGTNGATKQWALRTSDDDALRFEYGSNYATERMRIDSSGNVLVNSTNSSPTGKIHVETASGKYGISVDDTFGNNVFIDLLNGGTRTGSITHNNSGTTSYNTASDYRAKQNVVDLMGATARLKQLSPKRFNFIAYPDGALVDGFLAHEAQAVVPEAVTGTKDAMRDEEYEVTPAVLDEDGNVVTEAVMGTRSVPDHQGIDQSKLVPLLTAALQEAIAKIETLETKVAALENA